jgi:hypothetical protein
VNPTLQPTVPAINDVYSLSDYTEIKAVLQEDGSVSSTELSQDILRLGDDECQTRDGLENLAESASTDTFNVLSDRQSLEVSDDRYPFVLDPSGSARLTFQLQPDNDYHWIYLFLLVTTFYRMDQHRFFPYPDVTDVNLSKYSGNRASATDVFELLCRDSASSILGGHLCDSVAAFVFGTGSNNVSVQTEDKKLVFQKRVDTLCEMIGDGGGYNNRYNRHFAKDDGIDVVACRSFGDNQRNKLVLLGQCKTGSSWTVNDVSRLHFDSFVSQFCKDPWESSPVSVFFCSSHIDRSYWGAVATRKVLVMDRFRILHSTAALGTTVAFCKAFVLSILDLKIEG